MENGTELSNAYSEVYAILDVMEKEYVDLIPAKFMEFLTKEKNQSYTPQIDLDKPLEEQGLQRKTLALLAMLDLHFWCKDEEEKKRLINTYSENDQKIELEKQEKYSIDDLFSKEEEKPALENMQMVEIKEKSFIQKIFEKIQNLFKRK